MSSPQPALSTGAERRCPRCGRQLSSQLRFCTTCGAPAAQTRPETVSSAADASIGFHCERCQAQLLPGQRFCNACGATVGATPEGTMTVRQPPRPTRSVAAQGSGRPAPRPRPRRSPIRRALTWIALLALLAAGGYLRYTSTTCQLRRAFNVANWTCGKL